MKPVDPCIRVGETRLILGKPLIVWARMLCDGCTRVITLCTTSTLATARHSGTYTPSSLHMRGSTGLIRLLRAFPLRSGRISTDGHCPGCRAWLKHLPTRLITTWCIAVCKRHRHSLRTYQTGMSAVGAVAIGNQVLMQISRRPIKRSMNC